MKITVDPIFGENFLIVLLRPHAQSIIGSIARAIRLAEVA